MDFQHQLLIICPLVFFAGFVDSIAGGGGIISLPAYYAVGLPPHMALGTNKFASTFGTSISAFRFIKNKKVHYRASAVAVVCALAGSVAGARLAMLLSDIVLRYILIVALPILAIFILKKKDFDSLGKIDASGAYTGRILALSAAAGLTIGCYDGFFGPGTGTFLILIFNTIIGFDLLTSAGNAKMVNLASNIAALVTFILHGSVMFGVAVPAAICCIAGNTIGSYLALKNGSKAIKPALILVFFLLIVKIVYDLSV